MRAVLAVASKERGEGGLTAVAVGEARVRVRYHRGLRGGETGLGCRDRGHRTESRGSGICVVYCYWIVTRYFNG